MVDFDDVVVILDELFSIKTSPEVREALVAIRDRLRAGQGLGAAEGARVRLLAGTYAGKLRELRAARERARLTNGRRREGLSRDEVDERVAAKRRADGEFGF